ncbi:hypothetical protein N657DRAFT_650901 [Parathielavia appendiculata]|uniref:Peptidase S33 tripeptidyl aminopeptidase-like C-terminal domain-containing protein n=1 Tax=Parathielavia appendiculata TaxID=2587402 RepID=A0AAN6TQH0_9PEZI|nr:hypothetical protein N657DRAFT_650901 [Parathielavia appendiculata]
MSPTTSSRTFWSMTVLLTSPALAFNTFLHTRQADSSFDWTAITPTADLQYHPCYTNFQCARLRVPLDWSRTNGTTPPLNSNSTGGPFAAIALVTLPATVPSSNPAYAGPILINPGGPSGSGTGMALQLASMIQALVDVPGERHYDIVGFDPRGVALTTPSASCYESHYDRSADTIRAAGLPSVVTEQGLKMRFQMGRGVGELCAQANPGEESVFRYVSTATVARDMLEIVERSHELVVKAQRTNGTAKGCGGGGGEKPRLQYLGFSYGSILGNTFASMFPGRVGRMVLDGIADADDYMTATWSKNLIDAEAAIDHFYQTCFDAGSGCALRQPTDTSSADIRTRISTLLAFLQQSPVSAIHNGRLYAVTSFLISEAIRVSLYSPIATYEPLSLALADALSGNFSRILSNPNVMLRDTRLDVCVEQTPSTPPQTYIHSEEVALGIICGDSYSSSTTHDFPSATSLVSRILNQSATVGEAWTKIPLSCTNWPFRPTYSFTGPFGSPAPDNSSGNTTSATPLLILSTRTDHATPLANAYALSALHDGSAVVVQESVGHCALLSSVSQCTYGIVREYFRSGTVPANGTVCEAECEPAIPFRACPGLSEI